MALRIGDILERRYRVESELGSGAFGAVYRATDTRLNSPRALKVMKYPVGSSQKEHAEHRRRFQQEAELLANLDHANLPRVTDSFTHDGHDVLVMDFVDGYNMGQLIAQASGQGLEEARVLDWADQLLSALQYLHGQKPRVIHRDIKPENIIITPEGRPYLVDLGLVKLLDTGAEVTDSILRGYGTPPYAPLEQYGTGRIHTDERSDIYSLGATLYHALTGQAPPEAPERWAAPDNPVEPHTVKPSLSSRTSAAVIKALELQKTDRFQSATEMRAALAPPGSTTQGRSHARTWGLVMVVATVLLAIAFIAWAAGSKGGDATPTLTSALSSPEPTLVPSATLSMGATEDAKGPTSTPGTAVATESPDHTPTPSKEPTEMPSNTPPGFTATPTPRPIETPTPSCPYLPRGEFRDLWQVYRTQLGCPRYTTPRIITDCEQPFDNGHMFFRQDVDNAYVVYESGPKRGRYEVYTGWDGRPYDCPDASPEYRDRLQEGFGWIWCTQLAEPRDTLGLPSASLNCFGPGNADPMVQGFEKGFIFRDSDGYTTGMVYVFIRTDTDVGRFFRDRY